MVDRLIRPFFRFPPNLLRGNSYNMVENTHEALSYPQMRHGGSPPAHLSSSSLSDPSWWLQFKWLQPPPRAPEWLFDYYRSSYPSCHHDDSRSPTTASRRDSHRPTQFLNVSSPDPFGWNPTVGPASKDYGKWNPAGMIRQTTRYPHYSPMFHWRWESHSCLARQSLTKKNWNISANPKSCQNSYLHNY